MRSATSTDAPATPPGRLAWVTRSLGAVLVASVGSGIAGFTVTAIVGDVAGTFGAPGAGSELSSQIGLTGTTLGVALAAIRLASLGALPGSALADRIGRRRTLLAALAVGLGMTVAGTLAPGFWWWVAAVAVARPFLSSVNSLSGVVAAEETRVRHRSWALAGVGAAYGLGAGVVPVLRGALPDVSWRVVTALILVPLALVPVLVRWLGEPAIYERAQRRGVGRPPVLGSVPRGHRLRLAWLLLTMAALSLATGPGFTYVVVYAERVLGASTVVSAAIVLAAGPVGLAGLLAGRWLGDRIGRRPTAAVALVVTALGLAVAYSGALDRLVAGYLLAIGASATFGTPAAALAAEAFPTPIRATVAGWVTAAGVVGAVAGLAAFGVLADLTGGFADAARILAVAVAAGAVPLSGLPETRGLELDRGV